MAQHYKNAEISHEGRRYEIFWLSQFATHVCQNYFDKDHLINHEEITHLLGRTRKVELLVSGRHVFLGFFREAVYETYVTLVPGRNSAAGRCVVHSSFKSKKLKYIHALTQPAA